VPEEERKIHEKDLYPAVEQFLKTKRIAFQNTLELNYHIAEEMRKEPQSRCVWSIKRKVFMFKRRIDLWGDKNGDKIETALRTNNDL